MCVYVCACVCVCVCVCSGQTFDERIKDLSPQTRQFLTELLEYDPNKRISAAQALKHPFFTEEPPPEPFCFKDSDFDGTTSN
jgi:serine/threonine protein kinase